MRNKLPPINPQRILTGILVFLVMVSSFYIAVLWSDNQILREELAVVRANNAQLSKNTVAPASKDTTQKSSVVEKPNGIVPPVTDRDYVEGNRDASVMVIEYSDLECPFCKKFHSTVKELLSSYEGKIGHVYRHFPLSFHKNARMEAQVAECVGAEEGAGGYYTFIDTVFARTKSDGESFTQSEMLALAGELGFDSGKIEQCVVGNATKSLVDTQIEDAGKAGVTGTPATFIVKSDGTTRFISGALSTETYSKVIDEFLR